MDNITVQFVPNSLDLLIGQNQSVNLTASKPLVEDAWINFTYQDGGDNDWSFDQGSRDLIHPLRPILWPANVTFITFILSALSGGHMYLGVNSTSQQFVNLEKTYLSIDNYHVHWLQPFSDVIGWIYFTAWTISFWPQVFLNFYRKSVVGLNFDFVIYNFIGFSCYTVYNCVLFFSKSVQNEYLKDNSRGGLPVTLQDVCFAIHAVAVIFLTIIQIFIFERGNQRVSWICRGVSTIAVLFIIFSVIIGAVGVINWLMVIKFLSYVKLGSTLIKYMPQAYMNFQRKSTVGWSIWNVLLDFTGGTCSLLQMMILAYNFDDWLSILGNPTKFALGAFSVLFDILFIIQHYILYRDEADVSAATVGTDSDSFSDDNNARGILAMLFPCFASPSGDEDPLVPHNSANSSDYEGNTYSQVVTDKEPSSADASKKDYGTSAPGLNVNA